MRHVLFLVLGLVLGGLSIHAVAARADGEGAPAPAPQPAPPAAEPVAEPVADPADPSARIDAMLVRYEREVAVLKTEIEYLKSREAALSKYLLSLVATSANVRTNVAQARTQGFEAAAIPAAARMTVMKSLDQLAGDLSTALPVPTASDVALRRKADEQRRVAGWK